MYLRTSERGTVLAAIATLGLVSACGGAPENAELAKVEAEQVRDAAAAGRVACALGGAQNFRVDCTMDRISGEEGTVLVLGRADAGYRRFRIAPGRGVVAADGAEQATVTVVENGMIEVSVADDRYRLPATVRGGEAAR
jgi:hypothetical protein